ncbi:putative undecaprenyl-diphosphatase UppP [Bacteriovorax sp. BSW11_IV]|uniref:undecaprenyl-diphosphate phosphatase n=1 Tax=Bacteriovorax sp. BSW11_IV TaxID=1353529 RepID=UPI00038A2260|nr:undecaprenyl-diphosphate phosphatase [Bacteriovorax sp. BSW11_IV]EQC50251.1 putative undecaprenyl-diphosphatase UppP [Bacteriovorax sp. BSW11_IV]
MDYFCALIYGLIQGLTEFLPVSSSGHLALLPKFLEIKDPGVAFDLAMHVGTAMAIGLYFLKDIIKMTFDLSLFARRKKSLSEIPYTYNYIVATCCTVVTALLFKKVAESYGRGEVFIAMNLAFFGILLALSDRFCKADSNISMIKNVELKKAITIGLVQSFALFPGVSRSGVTITAGRFLNLTREEASRFSFLLSLPLIIGGAILKTPELIHGPHQMDLGLVVFGIFVSFVIGLLTIHFFLKFIKNVGLVSFGIYRLILAALIVYYYI